MSESVVKSCTLHKTAKLSYIAFFVDAERRDKRGERQLQCSECGLWIWETHYHKPVPANLKRST